VAVIRLALEIDGDVYPELHAMLSLIAHGDARAERVRQLAASGLLWETVRIYGSAAIGPNPAASLATATPVSRAPPAPDLPEAPAKARAAPKANARGPTRGRRATDEAAPNAKGRSDFVDLAIDAAPPADELPAARLLEREADSVPRDLPVLLDVVIPEASTKPARQRKATAAAPAPPLAPAAPAPVAETSEDHEDAGAGHAHETLHVASLAQKPATRSRLMRMKEKGLFKNG